jgi:hypothetical protein
VKAGNLLRPARVGAFVRDGLFRVERRLAKRFSDVELRQLRSLERAYNGRGKAPELLVFGDSAMFWTTPEDPDHRHLVEMIRDELGGGLKFEALVGPGYNPRIIGVYLMALARCQARPRVVIVPTSVLFATSSWLSHPTFGWGPVSAELREAIDANGRRPRRLNRPGPEAENAFDRLGAPSLIGLKRTMGELRLITNSLPTTEWQKLVRLRHMMDYYNGERLEPDSPGVGLVTQLGAMLKGMGLASVAYVPPVNHEVIAKVLGAKAPEHIARNATIVEAAYEEGAGESGAVVNAIFDSPAREFIDPLHLNVEGRLKLAGNIATAVRPFLDRSEP